MAARVRFRLPGGATVDAGPEAIVGRSSIAGVRVDDPRVSTVHAEISHRPDGLLLLGRGGRLLVDNRPVPEVLLERGLRIGLAPGVVLEVIEVDAGEAPVVPPTAGRERLRFRVSGDEIAVHAGNAVEPTVRLAGISAQIVAELLRRRGEAAHWYAIAEAVWPDEGALRRAWRDGGPRRPDGWTDIDERRLRNRWDQQVVVIRRQLDGLREGILRVQQGLVALELKPKDVVEEP